MAKVHPAYTSEHEWCMTRAEEATRAGDEYAACGWVHRASIVNKRLAPSIPDRNKSKYVNIESTREPPTEDQKKSAVTEFKNLANQVRDLMLKK